MTDLGKLLFNLTRFQILQAKLNEHTTHIISDCYAYAWESGLYPFMDDSELHWDLKEYFNTTKEQAEMILKYADDEWNKKRYYTFYEYEAHFKVRQGATEGINRSTLIKVFRYLYLHESFDDVFWKKLVEPQKHPIEAGSIIGKYRAPYIL